MPITETTASRAVGALLMTMAIAGAPGADAQAPWKVSVVAPATPVPVGACFAVRLLLKDASGRESPRNPAGMLVGLADFD